MQKYVAFAIPKEDRYGTMQVTPPMSLQLIDLTNCVVFLVNENHQFAV